MSTLSERWRNSSRAFRILFTLLLIILLLLLCLLAFFTYVWPSIGPAPGPAPSQPTSSPTAIAQVEPTTTPADTPPSTPTSTPVVGETPTVVETTIATATPTSVTTPTVVITPTATTTCTLQVQNVLRNGDFEEGFQPKELGKEWDGFDNGGAAFSFHIDDWPLVVAEGEHSQLIEIKEAGRPDRYFGIYQTAETISDEVYTFSLQGLVRTNIGDVEKTSYGYRLQVGFDLNGGQNWEEVEDWVELPWDEQLRIQDSFRFDAYTTTLTAETDQLTVFVRAWKKWADSGEGDYNVDDIQLVGLACVTPPAPAIPVTGDAFATIWDNVRVWASIALLLLLLGGAAWKFGWRRA
jgi:hypothetical protein